MHLYSAFLVALLPAFTAAHGYLSSPPPRGIEYVSTNVDRLKSPNFGNKVCRGEPAGQITQVKPGGSVTLDFTITAPHVGPCTVYLLDLDLNESKQVKIASMNDCAAPGKVAPWTIKLPLDQFGRKVLRWYWEASHNTPHEPYEQCVDLMIGAIDVNAKGGVTLYTSDKKADEPKMTAQSLPSPSPPKSMSRGYSMPPPARRRPMPPPRPIMPPMNDYAPAQPDYSDAAPEAYDNGPVDAGYDAAGAEQDRMDSYAGEEVSSAGSCENGRYTCNADGSFSICNNGEQVVQQCGPGQMCAPFNDSIQCVLSSSAEDY